VAERLEKVGGEARRWPSKPERNKSSLDQIRSKTPMATRTKENATQ
jgi:hypothetical protein